MNKEWQLFLEQQQIIINDDNLSYAQKTIASAESSSQLVALTQFGLIKVDGIDAKKFLQGQLSCDMELVDQETSQLGVHCNHKGRVIASLQVLQVEQAYYLIIPQDLVLALLTTLQKYAAFSKVELTDVSDDIMQMGVIGELPHGVLSNLVDNFIPKLNHTGTQHGVTLLSIPNHVERYHLLVTPEASQRTWKILAKTCQLAGSDDWELANIRSKLATIYAPLSESFTPHHLDFQHNGGVSFTKGCYTGQEIIARMQYLGKLKQGLYHLTLSCEKVPAMGESLYSEGKAVGTIINVCAVSDNNYELLAVVNNDAVFY